MVVACATVPPTRLSECPQSGTARFASIPIASRTEHVQARRFLPSRQENCLVYVVRGRDSWTGRSVRQVNVVLTATGSAIPALPPHPSMLPAVFGERVLTIDDGVYAMWELLPADYVLHAMTLRGYAGVHLAQAQGKLGTGMGAHRALTCASGGVRFVAVEDVGFDHTLALTDLDAGSGKESVRNALRSAGVHAGAPGYRDCELKW